MVKRALLRWWNCPLFRGSLSALALYTVVVLFVLYPTPFEMNRVIVGEEYRDAYAYTWWLWWVKQAVLSPEMNFAHLALMNYPAGIDHPFTLSMAGVALMALPFSLFLSPAAVYNLQVFLALVLSGLTMFWLCVDLTGNRWAGLVGGLIFAIFPNKMGHVLGGHLPQISMQWFPLYVLLLRKTIQRPGWRASLPTAIILALASMVHVMHLAYFLLPITLAVLAIEGWRLGRGFFTYRRIGWLFLTFALSSLMVAPFLWPTVLLSLQNETYLREPGTVEHATDLLAFFTPSPYHPALRAMGWLPPFAEKVFPGERSLREGLAYPGILVTLLAVWGFLRRKRDGSIWGILALTTAVLSLGPLLRVGRELVIYQVDSHRSYVVLPYALLKILPMFQVGRTPGRLDGTTMFALSILAAFGFARLLSRVAHRPRRAAFLTGLVIVVTVFEYLIVWPFPTGTAKLPPSIQQLAGEPGDGALLHVPMTRRRVNHRALYYQTFLPRPIVGGTTHRTPPEVPPWSETILSLAEPEPASGDAVPRPDYSQRIAWLRHFNVDWVIFHHLTFEKLPPDADLFYRDFIQSLLGPPKYADEFVEAFPVPDDVPSPAAPLLYTLSRRGWHPPEQDGGLWRRWMYEEGRLYIYTTRPMTGSLQFTVDSHLVFPLLEVYQGDRLLDSFIVGDRITYTTRPFSLTQGMNVLRFRAPDGCPATVDDPRCWADALLSPSDGCPRPVCDPEAIGATCRTFVFDGIRFAPLEDLRPEMYADVSLGDRMRLRGWHIGDSALHPGGTLTVTLTWEAMVPLDERYVVFVHLLGPDGTLLTQDDTPPVGRLLPIWQPEAVFGYPVVLHLPDDAPPGEYRLLVGVYLWPDLERLPVLGDVPGTEVRAVEIGKVQIVR